MWKWILGGLALLLVLGAAGLFFLMNAAQTGIPASELEARYMGPHDRFVDVDGARVRVREQGPANAPPIILLHGFTYSLESWSKVADMLTLDHRVISYDLLGHGLTGPDPKKRYSPQARAKFLGELMDKLGIEKADIAGNSLGGVIAWRFAAMHPDRVTGLILVDAPAFPFNEVKDKPVQPSAAMKLFLRTAPMAGLEKSVQMTWYDPSKISPQRIKLMQDMMRRQGNGDAFVQHIEQFTMPDPTALLKKLTMPVLIIWGANDKIIPPANGIKLKQAIPQSEMVTISHAGHVPQEEQPFATAGAMEDFLTEQDGGH